MRSKKYRHHKVDIINNLYEFEKELYNNYKINNSSDNNVFREKLKKLLFYAIENWLTDNQKKIILMYFVENLREKEIAQILNLNQSTVSRTLNRAKKTLRKYCLVFFDLMK